MVSRLIGRRLIPLLVTAAAVLSALPAGADAGVPRDFHGVATVGYPPVTELSRAYRGGATAVRQFISWSSVEPTPAERRWQGLDEVVSRVAQSGLELVPVLYGSPSWVSSNPASPPVYSPQSEAAWATFVGDLARRYGSNGTFWTLRPELPRVPIESWQLWNEVNLSFYWGGRPNARNYARLVRLTNEALAVGDPAAKLILAGLLPYKSTGAGSVPGGRYLQRFLRVKGVRKQFDAVAVHPYGKNPKVVLNGLTLARQALDAGGARRAPIWVTEFGWATAGVQLNTSPVRASVGQQARWVSRTYTLMRKQAKRLRLRRAFYFSLSDADQPGEDFWSARMGLLGVDGQPKPAWFSYVRSAGGQP